MSSENQSALEEAFSRWLQAWERYDLEAVLAFCHEEIFFENWTGARVRGKEQLRRAWAQWFAQPQGFRFHTEEIWIGNDGRTAVYRWRLEWPTREQHHQGGWEQRRGVDFIKFQDGLIKEKLTYSKTTIHIDDRQFPLQAPDRH